MINLGGICYSLCCSTIKKKKNFNLLLVHFVHPRKILLGFKSGKKIFLYGRWKPYSLALLERFISAIYISGENNIRAMFIEQVPGVEKSFFFHQENCRIVLYLCTLLQPSTSTFKGTVSRDFLLLVFFMNQFPPKPLIIPIGPFRIFSKIHGDIRSSRCTTGVLDTSGKWKKSSIRNISIILLDTGYVVELA